MVSRLLFTVFLLWCTDVAFQIQNVHLCMMGDSIISQMGPRQSTFRYPFSSASNLGVSGASMSAIASQVASIPAGATHVLLEGGTNDLVGLGTDAGIIPNYTSIMNAIPVSKKVIVIGIPQVDEAQLNITHPGWISYLNNSLIHQQNVKISQLCRLHANCIVATGVMAKIATGLTVDGIHPTANGDLSMINLLLPLMD